jgi:hypothetical protein
MSARAGEARPPLTVPSVHPAAGPDLATGTTGGRATVTPVTVIARRGSKGTR